MFFLPISVSLERAIEVIEDKRKKDVEKVVKTFDGHPDVKIQKGRWGLYLSIGKENYKLPKDKKEPENISIEDCLKIAEENKNNETPKNKKKVFRKKK